MPARTVTIDGATWRVETAGVVTPYERDEFTLMFVSGSGDAQRVRVTRYSPHGSRSRTESLAEMSDADLRRLFEHSQASGTSPEAGYAA
jgi:hypothetical protein